MPRTPLASDHDIGVAVLHKDGSLTLHNGPRLAHQTLTNNRFEGGVFEVLSRGSRSTRVNIRFDDGRRQSFAFIGTTWYELSDDQSLRWLRKVVTLLRNVRWTQRKIAFCGAGSLAVLGFVIWSIAYAGRAAQNSELNGSKTTVAGPSVKPPESQPSTRAKTQLSDEAILNNLHLTFEQKRSQLYDLTEVAGDTIEGLRNGTNYLRTSQRLGRYRVNFGAEAERAFSELVERVDGYSGAADEYCELLNNRLTSIRRMESHIYEGIKSGTVKPELRRLYIDLTSGGVSRYAGMFGHPATDLMKSRIVRQSVSAGDLFEQLVSIRCCQKCVEVANTVDKQIEKFLAMVPDQTLAQAGFRKNMEGIETQLALAKGRLLEFQMQQQELPAQIEALRKKQADMDYRHNSTDDVNAARAAYHNAQRKYDLAAPGIERSRAEIERFETALRELQPIGIVMSKEAAADLMKRMSKDAGVLEVSLRELLLDYPWPWPVATTPTENKSFSFESSPSQ